MTTQFWPWPAGGGGVGDGAAGECVALVNAVPVAVGSESLACRMHLESWVTPAASNVHALQSASPAHSVQHSSVDAADSRSCVGGVARVPPAEPGPEHRND